MSRALVTATNTMVAAKRFDDDESFLKEWRNLRELMNDRGGRDFVSQLVDVDEEQRILYLELALGSLDEQLEDNPHGYAEHEFKSMHRHCPACLS